eukprot:16446331-Heterocapsa_arctica.AAC.3
MLVEGIVAHSCCGPPWVARFLGRIEQRRARLTEDLVSGLQDRFVPCCTFTHHAEHPERAVQVGVNRRKAHQVASLTCVLRDGKAPCTLQDLSLALPEGLCQTEFDLACLLAVHLGASLHLAETTLPQLPPHSFELVGAGCMHTLPLGCRTHDSTQRLLVQL